MKEPAPLIVTLQLDKASAAFFNDLRRQYFPPAINYLRAHLTLFHHLPMTEPTLLQDLEKWSSHQSPLQLQVTEVKSIGKGVVYKIECPQLSTLHKQLQIAWEGWLIPQDKQKLWPHVTVQNKVSPAEAIETLLVLQASFQPFTATGTGFCLWAYEGGPWRFLKDYPFQKA
jgi:2'-5' RNA ligase